MIIALAAALALAQEEETTDTFRGWRPQEGHRGRVKSESNDTSWIKFSKGEAARPIKIDKSRAFEGLLEVLETEGRVITRSRVAFSKATHKKNIWEKPFSFQGAGIAITGGLDTLPRYAREDGKPFAPEEEDILREIFQDDRGRDTESDKNPFKPRVPLRPGQSFELSREAIASLMGGEKAAETFDLPKAVVSMTFKSVSTRAGARYAALLLSGTLPVKRFQEFTLADPFTATLTVLVDLCVDGSRPDVQTTHVFEIKGSSEGTLRGAGVTGQLEVEVRTERKFSLRTITAE